MTAGQYRAEVFLYAVLGSPLLLAAPLPRLIADNASLALVLNPELIAVNQDTDCVMGSRLAPIQHGQDGAWENWAGDVWVRPMADASWGELLRVIV